MTKKAWIRIISCILVLSIVTGCGNTASNNSDSLKEESPVNSESSLQETGSDINSNLLNSSIEENEDKETSIGHEDVHQTQEESKIEDSIDEEAQKKAEEESQKKAEEEAQKKAEEEAQKKAEEEAQKKAEEEAQKKAEEEAQKKAEEEAQRKAEEEAQKKAEEEKIRKEQLSSYSMMYYLAFTADEIYKYKSNRLALEDIYTSLLNDINPGAVDEITKDHLQNLRDIIKEFIEVSTKRDRLQFLHNQAKANAIRSAVPNPLAILSTTESLDWKKLVVNVIYTVVDSYTNYKNASDNADIEFLVSGWELDDQELKAILRNRDRAFNYMVDMVNAYNLDGLKTLPEQAITNFADICAIEFPQERLNQLVSNEATYELLGNYWLERANCYYELERYEECLECVDKYEELATDIFRQDFNYVPFLPKAIVAAQQVYEDKNDEYVVYAQKYADAIKNNTTINNDNWAIRYFAAQVYMDLYLRTNNKTYIDTAYEIINQNVTVLLAEQRKINATYLSEIEELTVEEPDYRFLSEQEKDKKEKEYKEEQKRVKKYNESIKEKRKTELPTLYEPLVLNCELLFALAEEKGLSDSEKQEIDTLLQSNTNGIFLTKPINDAYSFYHKDNTYTASMSTKELVIPAYLLTADSTIAIIVTDNYESKTIKDCVITKVERDGETIDSFYAYVSSKELKNYEWTKDTTVQVVIKYGDAYDKTCTLKFYVSEFEEHWYGDKVVFEQR